MHCALYFLDDVYFEIITNEENNGDGNGCFNLANKFSSVNHSNDDMPEEPGVESNIIKNACFEKVPQTKGRKLMRCSICVQYPGTVLIHTKQKNHVPAICSSGGTILRKSIFSNHLLSKEHIECLKVHCFSTLPKVDKTKEAPLDKLISAQNLKVSQKISEFMCTVSNDSKRGTISAWSWPSSEVAYLKRQKLDIQQKFSPLKSLEAEVQYINPPGHREMLQHIVIADIPELKNKLKSSISVFLRVDGSVDRFQIDNIHVLLKIITKEGNTDLLF